MKKGGKVKECSYDHDIDTVNNWSGEKLLPGKAQVIQGHEYGIELPIDKLAIITETETF